MELHQAAFCWWSSSLVCSGHKLCARKSSLLPMGFLELLWNIHQKNYMYLCVCVCVCVHPTEGSLNAKCCVPTPLPQPSQFPSFSTPGLSDDALGSWVSLEICCPSLSGLPCALRTISSFTEKRSWITVIIPEEREFPLQFPPRINQIHLILPFAEAFLPNCWRSSVLERWFQIFLYETDHVVLVCCSPKVLYIFQKLQVLCFYEFRSCFGHTTKWSKSQDEVLREHFTKSEVWKVSGFHREYFCLEVPRMGDFTSFYPGGGDSEQAEEP